MRELTLSVDDASLIARLWAVDCGTAALMLRNGHSVEDVLKRARGHEFIAREPLPIKCPSCTRAIATIEEWQAA
jgi:hypothetical protein